MLLVFRHFGTAEPGTLATMGKASMQRVGTELGTAARGDWVCDIGVTIMQSGAPPSRSRTGR
jgi:hypothetical protein